MAFDRSEKKLNELSRLLAFVPWEEGGLRKRPHVLRIESVAFLAPLQTHAVGKADLIVDRGDRLRRSLDGPVVM